MVVKLTYFGIMGLAEPIRLILAYGGEKYEDNRIPFTGIPTPIPAEIKSNCTWGQVPIVEIDGKKLSQSLAITRYFAKKHNLVPKDDFEAARCDEFVDACRDFIGLFAPTFKETDETKRAELFKEIFETTKTRFLSVFNSTIEGNDGKHLVGNSLTWADIYLANCVTNVPIVNENLGEFPAIKRLVDNVFAEPKIKEWIEKRPKTPF